MVSNDDINKKLRNKRTGIKEKNKSRKTAGLTEDNVSNNRLKGNRLSDITQQRISKSSSAGKKCIKCGTRNQNTAEFCIDCGNGLGENANMKICTHCGAKNPSAAQYCQKCGKNIDFKRNIVPPNDKPIKETPKGLSAGEGVVICLFSPIAGAIGYLLWHDDKPEKANQSCIIAVVALPIVIILYIAITLIYRAYFSYSPIDTTSDINSVRGSFDILITMIG
jgi:ribosomal protein L40E